MASEIERKRKEFERAKRELALAEKDKRNLPPIVKLPYTPENMHLSKAEFIAKRKQAEEDAKEAKEYLANKRGKKEAAENAVQEEEGKEEKKVVKKKTRPYSRKVVEE